MQHECTLVWLLIAFWLRTVSAGFGTRHGDFLLMMNGTDIVLQCCSEPHTTVEKMPKDG